MFAANAGGGVLDTSAPPFLANQSSGTSFNAGGGGGGSSVLPSYGGGVDGGNRGAAVPMAITPVFGGVRAAGVLTSAVPVQVSAPQQSFPPVYGGATPAAATPVFGGGRLFGSTPPSFGVNTNSSSGSGIDNAQRPQPSFTTSPNGQQHGNAVLDNSKVVPPLPSQQQQQLFQSALSSASSPLSPASSGAPVLSFGTSNHNRGSDRRPDIRGSVLGSTPAPPPFSSSAPAAAPPSSFTSKALPAVMGVERNVSTGGTNIQAFSSTVSSFSAAFGWAAPSPVSSAQPSTASAKLTASLDSSNALGLSSTAPFPPPRSASAKGDVGVLGGATGAAASSTAPPSSAAPVSTLGMPAAAAPPPSVFATATGSGGGATGVGMSGGAFGIAAMQQPPPPPSAFSSVFSRETTPSAGKTSVFGASAGTAAGAPPAKSAFGASTGPSQAPRGAPVPETSVFATSSASAPGGRGVGGGGKSDRDGGDAYGGRDGRRDRRRGRSSSPPVPKEGSRFAKESRTAPPAPPTQPASVKTPSFSIPTPRHVQQQQQQQRQYSLQTPTTVSAMGKLSVPSLPSDEKQWSLAVRVCKSFLLHLVSSAAMGAAGSSSSREVGAAEALEQAFFGVAGSEGVSGDFATTATEMLAVWQTHVRPILTGAKAGENTQPFPGELWVALFALGTYLNVIVSAITVSGSAALPSSRADLIAYKAGLRANPTEALTDACHYANELSELVQAAFQRGGEAEAPPYGVLPLVLRRVRTVFDEANIRGVATVQSNLNAVTSKLFAVLNRRVKASAVQVVPSSTPDKPAVRWLLLCDSKEKESLLHSFAYLVSEMIAADAPINEDVELFMTAFHECLPSALAERCTLYYRRACALLRQPLRMSQVEETAELLAKALAVYPPDAPPPSKRLLEVKLLTAELALGRLPSDKDRNALNVPQLLDVVNALKTSRLDLLDAALRMHGPFFVQIGVHNALMLARQRIALLMVVKYYVARGCENRLKVAEMARYHRLPYSDAEAGTVWLLPLLVGKFMNGVLDHGYLILSSKAPFDEYPRELLASAAGH